MALTMRLCIAILALLSVATAQRFRFSQISEREVLQREQNVPATPQDRESRIKQLFLQAGCATAYVSEQQLENPAGANVICRLPGKSDEIIVVGATYGQMAPDNWSGVSLLPSLYQTLSHHKRRHTFLFVAFADGNHDVAGSQFFVGHLTPTDVDRTEAMVNLEALGLSPTKISTSESDKQLVKNFMTVTYALKQMASQVDVSSSVHVDSEPFAFLHIPQITIHSLTLEAVAGLHDQKNDPDDFRPKFYYSSYTLVSGYLAYLDEILKPRHRK